MNENNGPSQSTLADRDKEEQPPREPKLSARDQEITDAPATPDLFTPMEEDRDSKEERKDPMSTDDPREYAEMILET